MVALSRPSRRSTRAALACARFRRVALGGALRRGIGARAGFPATTASTTSARSGTAAGLNGDKRSRKHRHGPVRRTARLLRDEPESAREHKKVILASMATRPVR